jgi:hypothetical protein
MTWAAIAACVLILAMGLVFLNPSNDDLDDE